MNRTGLERAADALDNHAPTCAADDWACCAEAAVGAYLAYVNGDES